MKKNILKNINNEVRNKNLRKIDLKNVTFKRKYAYKKLTECKNR